MVRKCQSQKNKALRWTLIEVTRTARKGMLQCCSVAFGSVVLAAEAQTKIEQHAWSEKGICWQKYKK